ncbi:hypothetical protein SAMN05421747_106139 [Parapedobacter composti]|uniref:Uncharacterized protein n=1 Tax=Parapedobacter composti TaxID=623281 RepID=A0A1I1HM29_9SPHI|nr:hypothetical protein [Parapedobacter composti]SFC22110.1 hypothetical protein SAMN05421747_106139 [Parapedobacter composti]
MPYQGKATSFSTRPTAFRDDKVIILLYSRTDDLFTTKRSASREDGNPCAGTARAFSGHEFHVWAFTRHREGYEVSTIQCACTVVLG